MREVSVDAGSANDDEGESEWSLKTRIVGAGGREKSSNRSGEDET